MGVVNNRIDIDALEKSSGGGGGLTMTTLWTGALNTTEKDIASELLDDYTDYTFLSAFYEDKSGNLICGNVLPVSEMGAGTNFINMGSIQFWITVTDTAFKVKAASSVSSATLYGIK